MDVEYIKSREVIENLSIQKLYIPIFLNLFLVLAIIFLISLVVVCAIKMSKRNKHSGKNKKHGRKFPIIETLILIILIALLSLSCWDLSRHILDVSNQSYLVYYGSFYKIARDDVKLGNEEKVIWKFCELDDGKTYDGYVIYSERTKKVLDYGDVTKAKEVKNLENNYRKGGF